MTSHTNGEVLATAIQRYDLDCVQMALNASRNGRFENSRFLPPMPKNLGIIAMKVTGRSFSSAAPPASRHRFTAALFHELTVTTAVVGMPTLAMLEQNTTITRNFSPLTKDEMDRLRSSSRRLAMASEHRLSGHLDGPRRPESSGYSFSCAQSAAKAERESNPGRRKNATSPRLCGQFPLARGVVVRLQK